MDDVCRHSEVLANIKKSNKFKWDENRNVTIAGGEH
jgi:hypothetical protein